mmetsp:Transcript_5128/g.5255  ORF Transcript_5128/g.5255 Transcript_5128/m.5255 type:complete len:535 (-) Transcript_5128:156-1760(-)
MVFISINSMRACTSCGRLTSSLNEKCGVCINLSKSSTSKKRKLQEDNDSTFMEPYNERQIKFQKRLLFESHGSTDDESTDCPFNRSFTTTDSDDDNRTLTPVSGSHYDMISPSSSYSDKSEKFRKQDGLSLLLEALIRTDSSFSVDTPDDTDKLSVSSEKTGVDEIDGTESSRSGVKRPAFLSMSDAERWAMMYDALLEYGRENLTCNTPNSHECVTRTGMSVKLGTWLSTQRQLKRKGNLRPEREAQLQELVDKGMLCWAMPSIAFPDDEKWTMMYNALVQFGTTYGHCNVPYSHESTLEDGTTAKLGAWLRKQREQKKKGILRPDRNARLQELVDAHMLRLPCSHFTDDSHWMHMLEMLEDYGAKHSHCNVPTVYEAMGDDGQPVRLGLWVRKQRELKKKCSLRPERVKALQELVDRNMFQWEAPNYSPSEDDKWNKMLEILVRYCQQYGHCNVSSAHETVSATGNTIKLGAWLSQQRHHHKKGKLRADREAKLQVLVDKGKLNWGMRCEGVKFGTWVPADTTSAGMKISSL